MILEHRTTATVDLYNCHRLRDTRQPFILVLNETDNVFAALSYCALQTRLKSASVHALGSIANIKLGYFHHDKKHHDIKEFAGIYEIVSLTGSITTTEGKPFIHIHAGISKEAFTVFGGHVIDAFSGPVSEFIINPLSSTIPRTFDESLGIYTICQGSEHDKS
ncbi:PPC domain-containing DNA-binding protein [Legionella bononiensis]|uniref:DNA-binding protein n=1 Tax=Legionella bononiensis TaxID=2793102 RepID=A0ABS1WB51_9GAMM|nr:PPC domain-containing DNA-binding protein [Legionella bononiensis]MBL7480196.1 DNA-binding protein [Legionella bononiensis]MBL7526572.1 DNA-binding protein [Legionella bononiensis]MBL7562934.1 DNA-binding protein [Legionella bononiensis]